VLTASQFLLTDSSYILIECGTEWPKQG